MTSWLPAAPNPNTWRTTGAGTPTAAGPHINLAKCKFGRQDIDFLGHHITKQGVMPLPSKVAAIREFARHSTVKGLQEFIGMVNFYHHVVPAAAGIMQALFHALSVQPREGGTSQCCHACPPLRGCPYSHHCQCFRSSCGRSSCELVGAARQWLAAATGLFQPAAQAR